MRPSRLNIKDSLNPVVDALKPKHALTLTWQGIGVVVHGKWCTRTQHKTT